MEPSDQRRHTGAREGAARSGGLRGWTRWYYGRLTDRSREPWRRALDVAAGLAGLGTAVLVLLIFYALVLIPFTPSVAELKKAKAARASVVLSADGGELARFERVNREWVEIEEVAPVVVDALIATEDHRFRDHGGVDVRRMIGAGLRTLTGDVEGASTLTQQLARNLYPDQIGRSLSLTRKVKEIVTAFKIESAYTKDEILETYLNSVPFLYNVYGIELAARTYFGTSAAELDTLEAATLVGMLKGTSYYNPARNPERARERRNVVLRQMVKRGRLSSGAFDRLREEPLGLAFERLDPDDSEAPHFTAHVRRWASEWAARSGYDIYADGLVLHTTLDLGLQQAAERAVRRQGDRLQHAADEAWGRASSPFRSVSGGTDLLGAWIRETDPYRVGREKRRDDQPLLDSLRADQAFMDSLRAAKTRVEVGFVAIDPRSGHVRAWVGSRSFEKSQYDRVARARRQPGSTFKPFVYARALEEGFSPYDTFRDEEVEIPLGNGRVWRPRNAGAVTGRSVSLRDALVHSKNTVTAQLIQEVGPGDVAALARRMGVNRSELEEVPSLALGTSEVTLLEMVSAYGTFANGGRYIAPAWITAIEDSTGEVVARFETEPEQALDEDVALQVLDMMRGVVDEGTGRGIRRGFGLRGDLAGKTGTTQNGADGWFMLIHPELVSGAWVGFDDPRVTFRSDYWGQGAHNALFVVGDFASRAFASGMLSPGEALPQPANRHRRRSLPERVWGWFEGLLGGGEDRSSPGDQDGHSDREDGRDAQRRSDGERSGVPGEPEAAGRGEGDRRSRETEDERSEPDAWEAMERREKAAREWLKEREEQAREAEKRWEELEREARKKRKELEREARKRSQERAREERKRERRGHDK